MRGFRPTIVLLALALVIVACTQTPAATPTPVPTPEVDQATADLLAAVEATLAEETVRVDQVIEFEGSTVIPDGTSAAAQGQANFGQPRQMQLSADFTAFDLGELEMVVDGSLVYMRGAIFETVVDPGQWILVDLESDDPAAAPFKSLASGQNDVSMSLYYLYGVSGTVDVSDGEEIRGQATQRYEMEVDLEAARDSIPDEQSEALEDLIASLRVAGIARQLDAEAWVGADGLIHRVHYSYALGTQQGGGSTTTTIDFSDFGAELDLDIPDEADVVPIEEVRPG